MRALVTGGAGFLGSHLCDALLGEGHSVIALDNLLTGSTGNLAHLANEPRFSFEQADITAAFDFGKVDYLFHFASPASPVDYLEHGIATLRVGSLGTLNALEAATRCGARFLFASTSECYGDPLVHPQPETYWGNVNPIGKRSVYDESKRFSEAAVMAYYRYRHLDSRIVRIFNTYGPRMQINDGRVVPNFMRQAIEGDDLTIYGDGKQTRSFCYVADEIDGIIRLAHSDEHWPVNIGNPDEFTVLACAEAVLRVTGSKSKLKFEPLPEDDPQQRRPDISKARALLGWEPRIGLETGLRLSLEYFQNSVRGMLRLKPLHTDSTLVQSKLQQFERLPTDVITNSLRPGNTACLKTRPDGTILDGHHRIHVLRGRGISVDALPREVVSKDD